MIRNVLIVAALSLPFAAYAQEHHHKHDEDHAAHQYDDHDHAAHDHEMGEGAEETEGRIVLSRTPEIEAALSAGGEPVVVEVLGAVCDFCAKAMNKTFGKREEVSAVYVDLDAKTLNLVFVPGANMDDDEIDRVVIRSGYKTKAIHRGMQILGEADAADPS